MNLKPIWGYVIVVLVAIVPLFGHLDTLPIQKWDEARQAVNALEMTESGNLIVTTYDGAPDMWNTKPPLVVWLQAMLFKTIGYNEIAVRLPSALAALATCLLLFWFFTKKYGKPLLGILAALILITTAGYVKLHGTRTGDYDALLTLFTTAYGLMYFLFLKEGKTKQLYLFFLFLTLAVYTKGIAAMLFAPALLLYTLFSGKLLSVLKNKHFYFGFLGFVVIAGGYYLLREQYNPGYLQAVYENELGGRFSEVNETHAGPKSYYLKLIINKHFSFWLIPALAGGFLALFHKSSLRDITVYAALLALVFLSVISIAKTKLSWYDLPIYPFAAMLAAYALYAVFNFAVSMGKYAWLNIIAFIVIIFALPYQQILYANQNPEIGAWETENLNMAWFMKNGIENRHPIEGHTLLWYGNGEQALEFYIRVMKKKGMEVRQFTPRYVTPGDTVAVYNNSIREEIKNRFEVKRLRDYHGVTVYEVASFK